MQERKIEELNVELARLADELAQKDRTITQMKRWSGYDEFIGQGKPQEEAAHDKVDMMALQE